MQAAERRHEFRREGAMLKAIPGVAAIVFALFTSSGEKPASATFVSSADVQATLQKAPPSAVSDQAIRMVDLGGLGYNVGVSVVSRPKSATEGPPVEHDKVTEIYHVISGSGTLVTGGKLIGAKPRPAGARQVVELNGPSVSGTSVEGGETRRISAGDVVIIPAGVNHWFTDIQESMTYIVVRVDPEKVVTLK
jgi:mannose-6-phosphate isomerase-like protein (cupin superfamily)